MNWSRLFLLTPITLVILGCGVFTTPAVAAPQLITSCQTIGASGSYILAGNLTATGDCLLVAADNVTIDLDGHTITGPGSGYSGITPPDTAQRYDITIRNGMIKGFGTAIHFALGKTGIRVRVERMTITGNTGYGLLLGSSGIVKDCIVSGNGGSGIYAGVGALVAGNNASSNGSDGIYTSGKGLVIGNVANTNGGRGIYVSTNSTAINNIVSGNTLYGISASCPSNLLGNTVTGNSAANVFFSGQGCISGHNLAP